MQSETKSSIRRFPLHSQHADKSAKFGAFGQWEVPLYYTTILEEHEAVRKAAGVFDISHMGEFFFSGPGAVNFLDKLLSRPVKPMAVGKALYTLLLNDQGRAIDDIILYRLGADRFLMIVNAANIEKDEAWIAPRVPAGVQFSNQSEAKGLLALQGPASPIIMERLYPAVPIRALAYYHCLELPDCLIARTGYTGEDGFEIMADKAQLPGLWKKLFDAGAPAGLVPAGFGARDTLRIEAGMPLYGHELDETLTPLEAGLEWTLDWNKGDFTGREALLKLKQAGITRKLAGLEMIERGIPRQGYEIQKSGRAIGGVTSGTFAPHLQKNIAMGYVEPAEAVPGSELEVKIRDKSCRARVVKLPFYRRPKT